MPPRRRLADNGGVMLQDGNTIKTHLPHSNSLAIDAGMGTLPGFAQDQAGPAYDSNGAWRHDVGAVEGALRALWNVISGQRTFRTPQHDIQLCCVWHDARPASIAPLAMRRPGGPAMALAWSKPYRRCRQRQTGPHTRDVYHSPTPRGGLGRNERSQCGCLHG